MHLEGPSTRSDGNFPPPHSGPHRIAAQAGNYRGVAGGDLLRIGLGRPNLALGHAA